MQHGNGAEQPDGAAGEPCQFWKPAGCKHHGQRALGEHHAVWHVHVASESCGCRCHCGGVGANPSRRRDDNVATRLPKVSFQVVIRPDRCQPFQEPDESNDSRSRTRIRFHRHPRE